MQPPKHVMDQLKPFAWKMCLNPWINLWFAFNCNKQ